MYLLPVHIYTKCRVISIICNRHVLVKLLNHILQILLMLIFDAKF